VAVGTREEQMTTQSGRLIVGRADRRTADQRQNRDDANDRSSSTHSSTPLLVSPTSTVLSVVIVRLTAAPVNTVAVSRGTFANTGAVE
jgi:hypothetical protein